MPQIKLALPPCKQSHAEQRGNYLIWLYQQLPSGFCVHVGVAKQVRITTLVFILSGLFVRKRVMFSLTRVRTSVHFGHYYQESKKKNCQHRKRVWHVLEYECRCTSKKRGQRDLLKTHRQSRTSRVTNTPHVALEHLDLLSCCWKQQQQQTQMK